MYWSSSWARKILNVQDVIRDGSFIKYIFKVYDCCMRVTMQVTLCIPAPETPDNTIHWPNADVMMGQCIVLSDVSADVMFDCYRKKISVLVFLMGQNPKCPRYNYGKNQGDKFKYIFDVYSFHHHRRCWSTFIQYLPTMYLVQRM